MSAFFYSYNSIVGSYDRTEAASLAEAVAIFSRPKYGIRRSSLKAVPLVYVDIIEAGPHATDEEVEARPAIGQARDWTTTAEGVCIDTHPTNIHHWKAALAHTNLRVHHHEEWNGDGELTRDDWYVSTPEWVETYHRAGGTWAYAD